MDFDNGTGNLANVNILTSSTSTLTLSGIGGAVLHKGNTAQRPVSPVAGTTRYTSDYNYIEFFDGVNWLRNTGGISGNVNSKSMVALYTGTTPAMSGTTVIPADTTAPLSTEGTQIWTQTINPVSLNSTFICDQAFIVDASANNTTIVLALFRGTLCIDAICVNIVNGGRIQAMSVHYVDIPSTLSPVTYSLRAGIGATAVGSSWYLNQSNTGTITFGGSANASHWTIMEMV